MDKLSEEFDVEYVPFWEVDDLSRSMMEERGGEHYYTPMSKAKHMYILQDIKRITSELGLELKWPPSPDNQHWEIPHLAYIYAREQGRGKEFFDTILKTRWLQGEDITDPEVVKRVAVECSLDPEKTADAFNDQKIREAGTEELMKSYEDGVFGIPFFVHGYNKFWGIDRFELFVRSLRKKANSTDEIKIDNIKPFYENTDSVFDTDHPGGCG